MALKSDSTPGIHLAAIVGPTAVGKTEVSVGIAPDLNAEIVSVDSMQVYRGMDIGTSKPGLPERRRARFHLLDVVEPDHNFTAAEYKSLACRAIREITARGKLPLLSGGSGLYYRAVVDDLDFTGFGGSEDVRRTIREEFEGATDRELHSVLESLDPDAAAQIPASNRRRVLRAVEVARHSDRLMSQRQSSWGRYRSPYRLCAVGLEMERELLYRRIDRRVDEMVAAGLLEEVRELEPSIRGTTAGEALGYKQMLEVIDGRADLENAVETVKRRTRNYAKRQMTWFGKDPRIAWFKVEASAGDDPQAVAGALRRTAGLILEYTKGKIENWVP